MARPKRGKTVGRVNTRPYYKRRYIGAWGTGRIQMKAEDFLQWCCHCKQHKDDHLDGKCLFGATQFTPTVMEPGKLVPVKMRIIVQRNWERSNK